jgi:hypothetical protein
MEDEFGKLKRITGKVHAGKQRGRAPDIDGFTLSEKFKVGCGWLYSESSFPYSKLKGEAE